MPDTPEVKVKLVLDDAAASAGAAVEQDLKGVADQAHAAQSGLGLLGSVGIRSLVDVKAAAEMAIAVFHGIGDLVGGTVVESFEKALDKFENMKAMSDSVSFASPHASIEALKEAAIDLDDEFSEVAIATGVLQDDIQQAFSTLIEHSDRGYAAVVALTDEMANAARLVPGGMSAMSEGMASIEMGLVKAKNPLVMMIAQTDLLHGTAKEVAAQMKKMTVEEQVTLAETAIGKFAQRAQNLPHTFNEVKNIWEKLKDDIYESAGAPILDTLTSTTESAVNFYKEHADQINAFATAFGERVSEFITFGSELIQEFYSVFSDDASKTGVGIKHALEDARDAWDDIRGQAHAIAKTFQDVVEAIGKVIDFAMTAGRVATAIVTAGGSEVARYAAGKAYDAATGQGDFAAKGTLDPDVEKALNRANRRFSNMNEDTEDLNRVRDKFIEAAKASGMAQYDIDQYVGGLYRLHDQATELGGGAVFDNIVKNIATSADNGVAAFVDAYQNASKAHNTAAMTHAAQVLESSTVLQEALLQSGAISSGAIEGLASKLSAGAFKDQVTAQQRAALSQMAGKGATVHMNGGQTFHIKQDFRDQDPDRVALVFQRDIASAAVNRAQSRLATAFGV